MNNDQFLVISDGEIRYNFAKFLRLGARSAIHSIRSCFEDIAFDNNGPVKGNKEFAIRTKGTRILGSFHSPVLELVLRSSGHLELIAVEILGAFRARTRSVDPPSSSVSGYRPFGSLRRGFLRGEIHRARKVGAGARTGCSKGQERSLSELRIAVHLQLLRIAARVQPALHVPQLSLLQLLPINNGTRILRNALRARQSANEHGNLENVESRVPSCKQKLYKVPWNPITSDVDFATKIRKTDILL